VPPANPPRTGPVLVEVQGQSPVALQGVGLQPGPTSGHSHSGDGSSGGDGDHDDKQPLMTSQDTLAGVGVSLSLPVSLVSATGTVEDFEAAVVALEVAATPGAAIDALDSLVLAVTRASGVGHGYVFCFALLSSHSE
jgi:hypothetical protein